MLIQILRNFYAFQQIQNLSSDDKELLEKSTKLLCHELQKSVNVAIALNFGLAEALESILVDEINFLYPAMVRNVLKLLQLLVMTDDGLSKVIKSEPTMKKLLQFTAFEHFEKFTALAADVLVVITSTPAGENIFCRFKRFARNFFRSRR